MHDNFDTALVVILIGSFAVWVVVRIALVIGTYL